MKINILMLSVSILLLGSACNRHTTCATYLKNTKKEKAAKKLNYFVSKDSPMI